MMRLRGITALVTAGAAFVAGCGTGRPSAMYPVRPVASGSDRLGLLEFSGPALARTALLVRARWQAHGDPAWLAWRTPERFGLARVFVTTGAGGSRMTLYLYDTAGQASRMRHTLDAAGVEASKVRTAGFCLYVGGRRLTRTRFDRLFDIAEARTHVA